MNSRLKAHANEVHHLGGCLVSFFFSLLFLAVSGKNFVEMFTVDLGDNSLAES